MFDFLAVYLVEIVGKKRIEAAKLKIAQRVEKLSDECLEKEMLCFFFYF